MGLNFPYWRMRLKTYYLNKLHDNSISLMSGNPHKSDILISLVTMRH